MDKRVGLGPQGSDQKTSTDKGVVDLADARADQSAPTPYK
jgi:hypothetical protein